MSVLTGVEALDDGRGVDEVTPTEDTHQMFIHLAEVQPARPLHNSTCNNEKKCFHLGASLTKRLSNALLPSVGTHKTVREMTTQV
jgi:hypothetical protein